MEKLMPRQIRTLVCSIAIAAGFWGMWGLAEPAEAGAIFKDLQCGTVVFDDLASGGYTPNLVGNCPAGSGILLSKGEFHTHENFGRTIHRAIYTKPGTFTQTFSVTPPWTAKGFLLEAILNGFASFQGNPGDIFSYSVVVTAQYHGQTVTAMTSGVLNHGANVPFSDFQFVNCLACGGGGKLVSTMVTTLSGPGEVHLDHTGIGQVAGAVPEPSAWSMMIVGMGAIGAMMRNRRRAIKVAYRTDSPAI